MKKLEKMASKVVASLIDNETYEWPPVCIGMLYQPERPYSHLNSIEELNVEDELVRSRKLGCYNK